MSVVIFRAADFALIISAAFLDVPHMLKDLQIKRDVAKIVEGASIANYMAHINRYGPRSNLYLQEVGAPFHHIDEKTAFWTVARFDPLVIYQVGRAKCLADLLIYNCDGNLKPELERHVQAIVNRALANLANVAAQGIGQLP